jgi:hypothetical protein
MGGKVICTCAECLGHWVILDGQRIPGKKISSQLRRRHEISATVNRSPEYPTKPSPLGVKEVLDEDNEEVSDIGKAGNAQSA